MTTTTTANSIPWNSVRKVFKEADVILRVIAHLATIASVFLIILL
jgi:hypothetical protein